MNGSMHDFIRNKFSSSSIVLRSIVIDSMHLWNRSWSCGVERTDLFNGSQNGCSVSYHDPGYVRVPIFAEAFCKRRYGGCHKSIVEYNITGIKGRITENN